MFAHCGRLLPAFAVLCFGTAPVLAQVDCNCNPQPAQFASSHGGSFGSAGGSWGSAGGGTLPVGESFGSAGGSFGSAGGSWGSAGGGALPVGESFGSAGGSFASAGGSFGSTGGSFASAGGSFGSAGGAGGYPLSQGVLRPLGDDQARIIINLPAESEEAVVYLADQKTTTEGLTRSYLIPVPKPDVTYKYKVKIVVAGQADVLTKVSEQAVKAGETLELNVAVGDEITIEVAEPEEEGDEGGGDEGAEGPAV